MENFRLIRVLRRLQSTVKSIVSDMLALEDKVKTINPNKGDPGQDGYNKTNNN